MPAHPLPACLAEENPDLSWFSEETQDKPHLVYLLFICDYFLSLSKGNTSSQVFCGGFCLV